MNTDETDTIQLYKTLRDNGFSQKAAFNIYLTYIK